MKSLPGLGAASGMRGHLRLQTRRQSVEAAESRLLAEDLHHLEERRRREGAGERESRGLREVAQLHRPLDGERARRLLQSLVREWTHARESLGQLAEHRRVLG